MLKRYYFLLLFLPSFFVFAQKSNIKFETLNLPDNVNSNGINCFYQSRDGFLWMGSRDGLIRYDGYNLFKIYAESEGNKKFSFGDVSSIIEPEPGELWVSNPKGVFVFNTESGAVNRFRSLRPERRNYRVLFETSIGEIVIGTNKGLFFYNPKTDKITEYRHREGFEKSLSNDVVRCVYEDKEGVLWIGTYDQLNKFNRKTGTFQRISLKDKSTSNLLQNNLILSINEVQIDDRNILLVGTETGLVLFDKDDASFEIFSQGPGKNDLSNSVIKTMEVVSNEEIWLGTDRGLNLFNLQDYSFQSYFANYNNSYTISNNIVRTVFKDSKGNMWLGSNNGVDKTFVGEGNFFHNRIGRNDPYFDKTVEVTAIDQDEYGNHWFATREGFCCFHKASKKYEWFQISDKLSMKISELIVGKSGHVWLATPQGLHVYDPKKRVFSSYYSDKSKLNSLKTNYINSLFEDVYGNVWLGTYKGGLYKGELKENNEINFTRIQAEFGNGTNLNSLSVNKIIGGDGDQVWISTDDGLKELNIVSGEIKPFLIDVDFVGGIKMEGNNILWMVANSKVLKYDIKTSELTEISNAPKGVRSIISSDNNLWICTLRNMFRLDKKGGQMEQMSHKFTQMRNYSHASYKNDQGELIFGGANGFVAFNPNSVSVDSTENVVQFTNLKVLNKVITPISNTKEHEILNKDINYVDELILEYSENTFLIEFSTLNFYNQNREKYRYILEGYESEWQEVSGKQHFASFTRVKPGNYIFKIKAANASGVFLDTYRSLKVVVKPPLWASTWAIGIYIVLVLVFLFISRKLLIARVNDINSLKFEKLQRIKSDELISSKTRFFTNISHELKTPLTLILSPTERLLKSETDTKKIATLEIIKRNTERLIRLVNQVLDVRKIETGSEKLNLERYDIVRFSKKIISLFEEEASYRKIKLGFSSEIEKLEMEFDMTKLEKIIFNLVSNAFKFTPDGGKIRIKVSIEKNNSKSYVCIAVKDNGIGISDENQQVIFERFTNINTANFTSQEGTGIGLSLVNDYVNLHKGFIKLKSKKEKGSSFGVHLPLGLHKEQQIENLVQKNEEISNSSIENDLDEDGVNEFSKLKLLVIEDDRDMRSFISSSFEDDFDLILAADGEEGYDKTFQYHPDIIISDVMMPKMDGITLCKKLKSDIKTSHIPLILLTAKGGIENKMEGISVGADDYIQKPFHLDYLLLRTKMLLSKREKNQKEFLEDNSENTEEITTNPIDQKFMKDLVEMIEKEMDNSELSVGALADMLGLDKTSLYRKIKSITGQTATAFIRHMRLRKAAELLKDETLNVSEVMYMVGYTHPSYFTRSFKELFDMAPSEYKTKFKI